MRHSVTLSVVAFALNLSVMRSAESCTTVSIPKTSERIVAKSYDWDVDSGMIVANLRGLRKIAFGLNPLDKPAKWTSKYASLTINQYGRELPLGGVNDKGLTVEIMWLPGTKFPGLDLRPTVNELQWIQYQLDNFANTAEAVLAADKVRISKAYAEVHYLVCDAKGECATFEFLKGKSVVLSGAQVPVPTLANDTYTDHLQHLALYRGHGGSRSVPTDSSSLSRFVRATILAEKYDPRGPRSAVDAGFDILDSVHAPDSVFNIVYESTSSRVHFRTRAFSTIKTAKISDFDLDCSKTQEKTQIFDMNQKLTGDISAKFSVYTEAENRRLVDLAFKDVEKDLPPGVKEKVITYPRKLVCDPAFLAAQSVVE